ncbi:MAG: type IX secretion system protein PorQ, partial [Bacteroidota bacterium]
YNFLNFTTSPRIAAMGGNLLSIQDNDINLAFQQPAFINSKINNQLSFNYVDYFSDINYGSLVYGKSFKKLGNFTAGLIYANYGKFLRADEQGNLQGNFYASDYALSIGWGRMLDSMFSIGANMKFIYSAYDEINSSGLAVDVGAAYFNQNKQITISVLAKNAGFQFKPYYTSNREPLPFEFDLGVSKRLKHIPLRYSITYHDLQRWDLTYQDATPSTTTSFDGSSSTQKSKLETYADLFMRHIIIGGELTFFKNFSFRLAYNYGKRQELKVESKPGTVGLSWGFGFRISKFSFNYARSAYHLVGSPNYLSITTNLSNFF